MLKTDESGLSRILKSHLHDQVYDALKIDIMEGRFAPGDRLSIRRLAELANTSIVPARDALRKLAAQNAVDVTENGTISIPKLSQEDIRIITRIRLELESLATELATPNFLPEVLSDLKQRTQLSEKYKADLVSFNREYSKYNRYFHFSIYRQADPAQLFERIIESLWLRIGPVLNRVDLIGIETSDEHNRILNAISEGDAKAASLAIREDIEAGMNLIIGNWSAYK